MTVEVRPGRPADLPALTRVYNHYVRTSGATFDVEERSPERSRDWFDEHADTGPHRLLVATDAGAVLGWASSGPLRPRPAYDRSVETSVYLDPSATGRGVGTTLYGSLLDELGREDLHRAFALVALPNDASDALHRRLGFREAGVWSEAGRKLGRWWDVRWYERPLP
ncbi:MAG TPA: GNAT family N-acetyltransferase [Actinomycetes bacterium]